MLKKWSLWTLVLFNMLIIWLLISGHEILIYKLAWLHGLPFGNLLTWLFMIAFPLNFMAIAAALGMKTKSVAGRGFFIITGVALTAGIIWGVFARLITGNWQFVVSSEFSGHELRLQLFWIYSFAVPALPLAGLLWFWVVRLIVLIKKLNR